MKIVAADRRALIVGGGILLALVVGVRGVPALLAWQARVVERSQHLASEVARAEDLIAGSAAVADSLAVRRQRLEAFERRLVPGETPAGVAAAVGAAIVTAAEQAKVELGPIETTVDSTWAPLYVRVTARFSAVGDIQGLTRLLLRLEGGVLPGIVQEASLSAADPLAPATVAESIRGDLMVVTAGLVRREVSP